MLLTSFLLWACHSKDTVSVSIKRRSWTNGVSSYCNFLFSHQISLHSAFSFFFKLISYWPWVQTIWNLRIWIGSHKNFCSEYNYKNIRTVRKPWNTSLGEASGKRFSLISLTAFSSQIASFVSFYSELSFDGPFSNLLFRAFLVE